MSATDDLWLTHYSVASWMATEKWTEYLRAVERILGDRLVKFDDTDPVRRGADTRHDEGAFIAKFRGQDASRWVRGRFEKTRVEIEIQHYKTGKDSFGRQRENSLSFYVPGRMLTRLGASRFVDLFRLGNERFDVFYGYADLKGVICSKKPSTPSLDMSRELLGVFWLAYFGPHYCAYFDHDKLLRLQEATEGPAQGITLQLAGAPSQVRANSRIALEQEIAMVSFVGSGGQKERGQYALTLEQLSSLHRIHDY